MLNVINIMIFLFCFVYSSLICFATFNSRFFISFKHLFFLKEDFFQGAAIKKLLSQQKKTKKKMEKGKLKKK